MPTKAQEYGYDPVGPVRTMWTIIEPDFTANLQGVNEHIPILKSIFVEEVAATLAIRSTATGLPASICFAEAAAALNIWEGPINTADQGATQFFPSANQLTGDPLVNPTQALQTGTAAILPFTVANKVWHQNFLWATVVKGCFTSTGPIGGPFQDTQVLHPNQYIREGSILTIHIDEDMSVAMLLDCEVQITLTYQPVRTIAGRLLK